MSTPYKYRPLNASRSEIRLLHILPENESEKFKKIPACHISHTSLHDNPNFVALSYVWGDANDARMIIVEDCPVRVTRNLYDAMMAFRLPAKQITIWIDAICIDQSNDEEKSWQVALMTVIYEHAHNVVAWLGSGDSRSDSTMDYLNSFGAKAEACGLDMGYEPYREIWQEMAFPSQATSNDSPCMIETVNGRFLAVSKNTLRRLFYSISGWHETDGLLPLEDMKLFFTRPWRGRIWILQEITLPDNAELVCGTKRITRRRCGAAINAFYALWTIIARTSSNTWNLTQYQRNVFLASFHHRPMVMLSSWRIYRYKKFPLAALLRATCVGSINLRRHGPHHLESSDPRDKVYALLGLAADRSELNRLGVFPDYTKNKKETYITTMAALLQLGYIPLLSLCRSSEPKSDLPSWVPDWSRSITHMLQDVEDDHITVYPKFSASGAFQRSKIAIIRKNERIEGISTSCCVYDEIREVGLFPNRGSTSEVPLLKTLSWPSEWLAEILRLSYYHRGNYKTFFDRLYASTRTSIGGVRFDPETRLARVGDERFLDAVCLLQQGVKNMKKSKIKTEINTELQKLLAAGDLKDKVEKNIGVEVKLGGEIIGKSLRRLPFLTKKGHLLLSSEHAKRGDIVALIQGAQVPFILRPQVSEQYQIISEAYVDGIMDGEAVEHSSWSRIEIV